MPKSQNNLLLIAIEQDNYLWIETIAALCNKTPEELIERLVNQKLEENRISH